MIFKFTVCKLLASLPIFSYHLWVCLQPGEVISHPRACVSLLFCLRPSFGPMETCSADHRHDSILWSRSNPAGTLPLMRNSSCPSKGQFWDYFSGFLWGLQWTWAPGAQRDNVLFNIHFIGFSLFPVLLSLPPHLWFLEPPKSWSLGILLQESS